MKKTLAILTALLAVVGLTQCSSKDDVPLPYQNILTSDQLKNGEDQYAMGVVLEGRQDYQEAFSWYLRAAENDYAKAQLKVAQDYERGKNNHLAQKWYKRLATHDEYKQTAEDALKRL